MITEIKQELMSKLKDKKGSIGHVDIDGYMSMLYANHKLDIPIKGMFDLTSTDKFDSKLYTNIENTEDLVFLDCSVVDKKTLVIDHHYITEEVYSENSYNPNRLTKYKEYTKKNSTGNILWLMYLLDEDVSKYTYKQKLMLIMADSFYWVYHQPLYHENALRWLKNFKQESLIEVLESPTLNQDIYKLKSEIGVKDNGYVALRNGVFMSKNTDYTIQEVFDKICNIMEWKQAKVPEINYTYVFENKIYADEEMKNLLENEPFTFAKAAKKDKISVAKFKEKIINKQIKKAVA